jgi:undecaprenyl-diphosphatase
MQGSVGSLLVVVAALAAMVFVDAAATEWARHLPSSVNAAFEQITNFGLSGWFLFPFGFALLFLAMIMTAALPRMVEGVLAALAARFGFLFLAIAAPGLFTAIVKRLIGRARPYVGGHDDPFLYRPFIWRSEYASLPSGHSTSAAAAAFAIGAIWPRARWAMWLYALLIMFSRVVVFAHHASDVILGMLVGVLGAAWVRRSFAARRLVFSSRDFRAYAGPSLRRIGTALRRALVAVIRRGPNPAIRPIEPDRDAL